MELHWLHGHADIPGNEIAEKKPKKHQDSKTYFHILLMPYIKSETESGKKRMTNSNTPNQIPGHGKMNIDVEMMKLLSTDSEPVIHY